MPDQVWQAALEPGCDTGLAEAPAHIVLNLFTNHCNHLVQADLDLPPAAGL